ncbi:MAG: DMT family transporter [Alphaproteobacteria bacterium]|nr:DMT family transporter [Alphaproteobacteria bacterium]
MTAGLRPMAAREWALLILLSGLWGGSFFFAAIAVAALPPLTIVAGRVVIGAAILGVLLYRSGEVVPVDWRSLTGFVVLGLTNHVVPFSLIVWGQQYIASGLASILTAVQPLFTILIAHLLTRDERITGAKLVGVLFGLAGVVVLVGIDAMRDMSVAVLAQLAMVAAACSFALGVTFGRRLQHMSPSVLVVGQLAAAGLMIVPMALVVERPWLLPLPGAKVILSVLALALFSTAIGYRIYFRILAISGATSASLVAILAPVATLMLGIPLLGERLEPNHIVGMVLILAGLAVIDGRLLSAARRIAG